MFDIAGRGVGYVWLAYRGQAGIVASGCLFALLWQGAIIMVPILTAKAIDLGIADGNKSQLALWSLLVMVCIASEAIFSAMRHQFATLSGINSTNFIRSMILQSTNLSPYSKERSAGKVVSSAESDSSKISILLQNTAPAFSWAVSSLVMLAIVGRIDGVLLLALTLTLFPLTALCWLFSKYLAISTFEVQQRSGHLTDIAQLGVGGQRSIAGLGAGDRMYFRWSDEVRKMFSSSMRFIRFSAGFELCLGIGQTLTLSVVFIFGIDRLREGQVSVGEFVALVQYATMLGPIFVQLGHHMGLVRSAKGAESNINDVFDGSVVFCGGDRSSRSSGACGSVTCKEIFLSDKSVDGWSADFASGRITAVLTGDGPELTGLARVLAGHERPQSGQVLVDGRPLSSDRHAVLVSREDFLFTASVRDNLTFGAPDATDSQLDAALRIAVADRVITALPEGLDTMVQPRATNLSGGQRQRLCLARALLAHPDVLILADALAALDPTTAGQVIGNLRDCGCTVILLTREPSLAQQADRVLRLPSPRGVHR